MKYGSDDMDKAESAIEDAANTLVTALLDFADGMRAHDWEGSEDSLDVTGQYVVIHDLLRFYTGAYAEFGKDNPALTPEFLLHPADHSIDIIRVLSVLSWYSESLLWKELTPV
jgi:hypothetical protein